MTQRRWNSLNEIVSTICPKCQRDTLELPLDRNPTSKFDKNYGDTILCNFCAVAESFYPAQLEHETRPAVWEYVGTQLFISNETEDFQ